MAAVKQKWNSTNSGVKRIMKEAQEIREKPCREFTAQPLEENVFEWVFTMRGPDETDYENGFYRGRIMLPADYPFAPPDIMLLAENGRFEIHKKICLSVTSYHPENWKPTWGITTVILALREFMSTPGNNAIGAVEYPKDKRRQFARESHSFVCPILKTPITEDIDIMNRSPSTTAVPPPPLPNKAAMPPAEGGDAATSDDTTKSPSAPADQSTADPPTTPVTPPVEVPPPVEPPPVAAGEAQEEVPVPQPMGIIIEESTLNKGILIILVAILAILGKKFYAVDLAASA